jgi:4-amino-4-deoxy-L-arabinose transferase-like glycosyltransferase
LLRQQSGGAVRGAKVKNASSTADSVGWWDLLILASVALLLRILYLLSIRGEPFFATPLVDSKVFWEQAVALATGTGAEPVFFKPPLLTWLLAGLIKIFGEDFTAARTVLAVISAGAAPLTARLASHLLDRKAALAAGAVVAVYAPAVFHGPEVLPASLVLVLNLVLLLLLARVERLQSGVQSGSEVRRRPGLLSALAGLMLGLSALARPTILLLVPVLLVRWRRRPRAAGLLLAGVVLMILPVLFHNARHGSLVPISSNGGINFYLGNHAGADGKSAFAPELSDVASEARQDAISVAQAVTGRQLSDAAVSRYWYQRGLTWLQDNPGEAISLWGRKFYYLFNNRVIPDNIDFYAVTEVSTPLRLLPVGFGLLLACTLPGIPVLWRSREGRLLLLYGLAVALPVVVFFVVARFRLPLLPVLAIGAVAGVQRIAQEFRRAGWWLGRRSDPQTGPRARRQVLGLIVMVALVLGLSYSRLFGVAEDHSWHYYRNSGDILYRQGRLEEAAWAYEESLRRNERIPDACNALGFIYAEQGIRLERAEELIADAIRLKPGYRRYFLDSLGWVLFKRGKLEESAAALAEAISLLGPEEESSRAEAMYHLGHVRRAQGRLAEADRLFRDAASAYPRAAAEIATTKLNGTSED